MGIFFDRTDSTYIVSASNYRIKTTVTASAIVASYWIDDILCITGQCLKPVIVGLDIEWCPQGWHGTSRSVQNPVALLQLCVGSRCLLFQLLHCDHIPAKLYDFFLDDEFHFVGVDIQKDLEKLDNQYGLKAGSCWDELGNLATEMGRPDMRRWSLKSLMAEVVCVHMEKPDCVRRSDWSRHVLNQQQIEYAALDAFASFQVGLRLVNRNF